MGDEARRIVLRRRARFVAAALASVSADACAPRPSAPSPPVVNVTVAGEEDRRRANASGRAEADPEVSEVPTEARAEPDVEDDPDRDGIATADDACPHQPGSANPDPRKHGCPCLSIVKRVDIRAVIPFAASSSRLASGVTSELDQIASILQNDPDLVLHVEAHCDSSEQNDLAKRRAKAVVDALVARGIDAARMQTTTYGSTRPVARGTSEADRAKNRRVELRVAP